jgi:Domain of unknown function (DUF4145)
MSVPPDWSIRYVYNNPNLVHSVQDPRAICPHCRNASTFAVNAQAIVPEQGRIAIHLVLRCNYAPCHGTVYIHTSVIQGQQQRATDPFFMYPTSRIDRPHCSIPAAVADDWLEAQKAMQANAPKAAAVMLRRVLYSVLIDKKCKLLPLRQGMEQLISEQRLPAVFDSWLPAIRDDGHDGAHPDRALQVDPANVAQTIEYTAELLRFLYIEPYEFLERTKRSNSAFIALSQATSPASTMTAEPPSC